VESWIFGTRRYQNPFAADIVLWESILQYGVYATPRNVDRSCKCNCRLSVSECHDVSPMKPKTNDRISTYNQYIYNQYIINKFKINLFWIKYCISYFFLKQVKRRYCSSYKCFRCESVIKADRNKSVSAI